MEARNTLFPLALTFDDVLLLPGYADFTRSEIDLSTKFSKRITLASPLVSAPMDTVTESKLAIKLAQLGGIGIIHRNLSIEDQAKEVAFVKKENLLVGAAVGAKEGYKERLEALIKAGVDVIVIDSADGFKKPFIDATRFIKQNYPEIDVVAGNVATEEGAQALIAAGADGIRVGMGPGAICTTRVITGMGVPQITAIMDTVKAGRRAGVPIIADGGIKYSGDMVKALAAGASTVMMGSFFAATIESPGRVITLTRQQVPKRFLSILSKKSLPSETETKNTSSNKIVSLPLSHVGDDEGYQFKEYRGMGSVGAMEKGAEIKSGEEFHGKDYKDRVLVAEGVEGLVPIKGTVQDLVDQAIGGIRSGMYNIGAKTIIELQKQAKFIQITQASLVESHPHDLLVTNPGKNYA